MEKRTMGALMSALRKSKGMTQQDIADKLGISNKTVSKWECDDGYPDISMLPAIAEIYGVSVDELLKGKIRNEEKQERAASPEKGKKQIELLLSTAYEKFKNTSVISLVFALLSIILGFLLYSIIKNYTYDTTAALIAFCVSLVLSVVAFVLEWFAGSKLRFSLTGEDASVCADKITSYLKKAGSFISVVIGVALVGVFGSGSMWYVMYYDAAAPWVGYFIGVAVAVVISFILYFVFGSRLTKLVDDERVRAEASYSRKTALGLLIGTLCVALVASGVIGGVYKATNTHKVKFDNEEYFNSFTEFAFEEAYPLLEKDEESLSITFIERYNFSSMYDYANEPSDIKGVISQESGTYELTLAYGDQEIVDTYIYTFDTKEHMQKFIDDYCVDSAFLSNCTDGLLHSANCIDNRNYDKLTVTYTTGYFNDVAPLYAMMVLAACIVFDVAFIIVRKVKAK